MKPINRYLLIEKKELEEEKELVLLPEGYSKKKDDHETVKVLDVADTCTSGIESGQSIVVQSNMIEEIRVGTKSHCLILENYVLGIL